MTIQLSVTTLTISPAAMRRRKLLPYQVNEKLFALAKKDAFFMHCLPAHAGEEVTQGVLDNPRCIIFDEAENRLHVQKAILAQLGAGRRRVQGLGSRM